MTDLARWLAERRQGAPRGLRRALDEAVAGADGEGAIPDRLAAAGLGALRRAARGGGDRSTALALLAADALLTYAFEAAAEAGPDELDRLLASLDFDRFAGLLAETDR